MSSPYRCSPPFHPDPGDTRAQATSFYLVSSPAALDNRGIYTSWSSAQRICENIPRGGTTKFSSWEACLPVWHACCDAGEHSHPSSPTIPACLESPRTPKALAHSSTAARTPRTPTTATSASPSTVSLLSATGATFSFHRFAPANSCRAPPHPFDEEGCDRNFVPGSRSPSPLPLEPLRCGPTTLSPALDLPLNATQTYVVRGSGAIHTSLDDALADFTIAAARGQATLCATDNPRIATHVAAGHTLEEARALVCLGNLGGQVLKEEYAYDSDNEYWRNS
ncbi:hypothetical protein K438DRAFT_2064374 [Mycena galopus ATCC 62051]|nr:hypothetical protein K438DRAFT_2064374 [Mycena galopus ATCC 62051]